MLERFHIILAIRRLLWRDAGLLAVSLHAADLDNLRRKAGEIRESSRDLLPVQGSVGSRMPHGNR